MLVLDLIGPDFEERRVVLRAHSAWELEANPDIALDEYRLLQTLVETPLPVVRPLHVDQTCEILPTPVLVLEYVEGKTRFQPEDPIETVFALADMLIFIHGFDPDHFDLKFLPLELEKNNKRLANPPDVLDTSLDEGRIRTILDEHWPHVQRNPDVLLHGDFWPGNVLWIGSMISSVIDWENACRGDPVEDFANARMEVLWAYGYEAMEAFSLHYIGQSDADLSALPVFDLMAALRPAHKISLWGMDPVKERSMRNGHRVFVEQALVELER